MPGRSPQDRDALLMKLSALLDGELPEAEQNQLFDAMGQDPALLAAFEALAHTRTAFQALPSADAGAVTAAVMAAVDPDTMPASVEGALALASRALDGAHVPTGALHAALEAPRAADAVLAFVAANELVRAGGSALAASAELASALRPVADRVDAAVASAERAGVLALAHADGALSSQEQGELEGLWGRLDDASLSLPLTVPAFREALVLARDSAAFQTHARRAGDAAVQAVEAIARQQSPAVRPASQPIAQVSFFVRVWQSVSVARLPLAFAGAAAALFFAVRAPAPGPQPTSAPDDRAVVAQALLDALSPALLTDTPRPSDLPLLADNAADVEALDANGTTMVFSTSESNITVIWVSGEDDEGEEQGT
jgi:negative regulator of sigma E activity